MKGENYRVILGANTWQGGRAREVREVGCNIAQSFSWSAKSQALRDLAFEKANEYGIKLMPFVLSRRAAWRLRPLVDEELAVLLRYRDNPALFGWHMYEEPEQAVDRGYYSPRDAVDNIQARYNQLHALFPNHYLMITGGWSGIPATALDLLIGGGYYLIENRTMEEAHKRFLYLRDRGTRAYNWIMDLVSKGVLYIPNIQATPGNNPNAEWLRSKIPIFYQWYRDVYGAVIDKNVCYYGAHKIFDFPVIYEGVKALNYEQLGATPLVTYTKKTITCSQCGSTLELTTSSKEEENIPQICPVCGQAVDSGYTVAIISEEPWPIYGKTSVTCPQCSSELELTVSSKPEENTARICPVCGASIGEGTEVAVTKEEPWPPIGEVVPWYRKYAPHLVVGGVVATIITYFSLRKRG